MERVINSENISFTFTVYEPAYLAMNIGKRRGSVMVTLEQYQQIMNILYGK